MIDSHGSHRVSRDICVKDRQGERKEMEGWGERGERIEKKSVYILVIQALPVSPQPSYRPSLAGPGTRCASVNGLLLPISWWQEMASPAYGTPPVPTVSMLPPIMVDSCSFGPPENAVTPPSDHGVQKPAELFLPTPPIPTLHPIPYSITVPGPSHMAEDLGLQQTQWPFLNMRS